MNKQSDQTTLNNQSQKNDRNERLRTILQEFREHPNHHASPALVAALIELETELDANSEEQEQTDVCFQLWLEQQATLSKRYKSLLADISFE